MTDPTLTLALLGCGEAARMHARTLTAVDDAVRLRFASRDRARAEAYSEELGGERAYGSYEEAIGDPEVDCVLVLAPPHRHAGLALAALEAGRDVVVEKPAFPSAADFQRIREAQEASAGRVLVAENYHYKPLLQVLRELLEAGVVGDPLLLQVDAVKEQETSGWRDDPGAAGGGALMEGGIHWVHFMAELGEVEAVEGHVPPTSSGAERTSLTVFRYASGAVGTLAYSWEVPSPLKGLRLSRIYGRGGALTFESNGLFVFARGVGTPRLRLPGFRDIAGYRAMFRDLLSALRGAGDPSMTLAMAERDVRLVEQAYAS